MLSAHNNKLLYICVCVAGARMRGYCSQCVYLCTRVRECHSQNYSLLSYSICQPVRPSSFSATLSPTLSNLNWTSPASVSYITGEAAVLIFSLHLFFYSFSLFLLLSFFFSFHGGARCCRRKRRICCFRLRLQRWWWWQICCSKGGERREWGREALLPLPPDATQQPASLSAPKIAERGTPGPKCVEKVGGRRERREKKKKRELKEMDGILIFLKGWIWDIIRLKLWFGGGGID